jgi:hypothetical protein
VPRDTFQIDAGRLVELRSASRKTQLEVGAYLREASGKGGQLDSDVYRHSVVSTYQKLERTGKTSKKTAQALANYFHVPLAVLEGREPIDTADRILALLKPRLSSGANAALKKAYEDFCKETPDLALGKV